MAKVMRVTDNMLETLKFGGSLKFMDWIVTAATPRLPRERQHEAAALLFAISPQGDALEMSISPLSELSAVVEAMFKEINSRAHLPKSAYKNGIRLDTENRCQSSRCNPKGGKSRLLFVSAGRVDQVIQVKCKCGYVNTFWRNRIQFDEFGALKMEAVK